MDIKQSKKSKKQDENETIPVEKIDPKPIRSGFKCGQVELAGNSLLPAPVKSKLANISKAYGLPIDLGNISLSSATPDNIKAVRQITDLMGANSKLLPELMKLTAQLLKADIKLADFHVNLTKASVKHQEKIDKATADIWLSMAGYGAKASKLEHRTNFRSELISRRQEAYNSYYENSVYGGEAKILEVEYELAASNRKILNEGRTKRMESVSERKQKLQQYIDSAYAS